MSTYARFLALGSLCLLAGCGTSAIARETLYLKGPAGPEISVAVEIADTPALMERGLMGRKTLPDNTGMLFVFHDEKILTFWMKNTLVPLDIVFFDADGSFVSAETMVPCTKDPCTIYSSSEPAGLALEVPSGFLAKNGVGEGWMARRK